MQSVVSQVWVKIAALQRGKRMQIRLCPVRLRGDWIDLGGYCGKAGWSYKRTSGTTRHCAPRLFIVL
jgi:hypothetical protein